MVEGLRPEHVPKYKALEEYNRVIAQGKALRNKLFLDLLKHPLTKSPLENISDEELSKKYPALQEQVKIAREGRKRVNFVTVQSR